MKVTAKLNNLRIAPRKTKLAADLIKGLDVNEAFYQLNITVKRACPHFGKLLQSAVANAENNLGLSKDNLYVYDAIVGAGPTLKRWMPKAYGRAGKILKRTSNITIVLEERIEGKDRKSKEQMEEEKKRKIAEKQKSIQEEKSEKKKTSSLNKVEADNKGEKKGTEKKSWGSRIFRRKSM